MRVKSSNVKYPRKISVFGLLLFVGTISLVLTLSKAVRCTSEATCLNGGICKNEFCVCTDGWQGPRCQYCGGKVRLTDPEGIIHDGFGNYSGTSKCSWLIDARDYNNSLSTKSRQTPSRIRLHLEKFATECGWDYLYVYDGDSVESPLLAVFSGVMYPTNSKIRRVPEIIAKSGSAFLYFFSDEALTMSGFNISYKINGCPTNNSAYECSGRGVCMDGECTCEPLFTGDACNIPICPNNCSLNLGQGECDEGAHECKCKIGFGGMDCTQRTERGVWTTIPKGILSPRGSASHGATVWRDTLFIIGGETYNRGELAFMYDFKKNAWETVHPVNMQAPDMRYGASTVLYDDKIFMYGGIVKRKGTCGELWAFDISARTWENIAATSDPFNSTMISMCGPLKSAGHSATLVPGHSGSNGDPYMVVIFGHSPQFGYLNTVQEFNFVTREWKIVETNGYVVNGGYGHSAAYDPFTAKIYVYGGIVSESESIQTLSNKLYAYEPSKRTWSLLSSAPTRRSLHTANFVTPGLMMVFGGNTYDGTSSSHVSKCYSKDLIVYDVLCDSWHNQSMPKDLDADLARFGHSAVTFDDSLYIYGGFDGQLLADMLKYTPGNCSFLTKKSECLSASPGMKCLWHNRKKLCVALSKENKSVILSRDQEYFTKCPSKSRQISTKEHPCSQQTDCQSCTSTAFGCIYCGNGTCSNDKCLDTTLGGQISITSSEQCPYESGSACIHLHSCFACASNPSCHWEREANRCHPSGNFRSNSLKTTTECPPPCNTLTTCTNCTDRDCIWCPNEQRCVDRNAYTVSFPYGQCRDWTIYSRKCPSAASGSQCGFYKTCSQCREDPTCGWCDDDSEMGFGQCLPGGDSGPHEEMKCPARRWFFTQCPSCQCNGHSRCSDGKTCDQPCSNLREGANCERCRPGFWGNPLNSGTCQKCECNDQATNCHMETGKCFCHTKGLVGDHCEKCDTQNHYHGDPTKGLCYYDLTIDYQFTFNLSREIDRHYKQINFRNSPLKADVDTDFTIKCGMPAKLNVTVRMADGAEKVVLSGVNASDFHHRFSHTDFQFGVENNIMLTTFYVTVYDFQTPGWIQIAFAQYPKLNLISYNLI